MSRNEKRRNLFQKHFQRMSPNHPHVFRQIIGYDSKGKPTKAFQRTVIQNRTERRKLARAFAAGDWKRMKANV